MVWMAAGQGDDPAAIVTHANQPRTTVLDVDLDTPRAGVQTVLDQFLDHRCRPLDHFASGDLVDEFGGKFADAGHPNMIASAQAPDHAGAVLAG